MDLPIDDENAPLYSVGQVSDMLGVQAAFLRRLDTEDVVRPGRSLGGQRRYSRSEVTTVARVAGMASDGFGLNGIRRILELENHVAALQTELADERRRTTGERPKARD
ncbi:MAG: MerR family transcriptional regulator, heat shock protein HspR [Frankiaceae bacterium]|nr:MerR family transcriptional regulator, heat shock protein HspR [Frankiaceae bacterium]MDQ1649434.1 MerR family transcriptional regulator, heat shock protein HspR [Frankiaceae bacterium]MDQ1673089.1 MerR family transcriptional regulator, heat shock protein HspR [Frankiaceae bacterium]